MGQIPRTVLVIDDENAYLQLSSLAVKAAAPDLKVVQESTAEGAMMTITMFPNDFGLVVSDLNIPGNKEGNILARLAFSKNIPVIIYTSGVEDVAQDVREKCLGVFKKIAQRSELVAAIKKLFEP